MSLLLERDELFEHEVQVFPCTTLNKNEVQLTAGFPYVQPMPVHENIF
jgi:hypothetical protein